MNRPEMRVPLVKAEIVPLFVTLAGFGIDEKERAAGSREPFLVIDERVEVDLALHDELIPVVHRGASGSDRDDHARKKPLHQRFHCLFSKSTATSAVAH